MWARRINGRFSLGNIRLCTRIGIGGFFQCFEGMLHSSGQMVVKIQRIYFFKEKEFAKWVLDNTILAEKTSYSR